MSFPGPLSRLLIIGITVLKVFDAVGAWAADDVAKRHFDVRGYRIEADNLPKPGSLNLDNYMGTSIGLGEMVQAASLLQTAYASQGYTNLTIAIAPGQITNGLVTLNVFHSSHSQILVAGERYVVKEGQAVLAAKLSASELAVAETAAFHAATNAPAAANTNAGPRFVVKAYEITGDTLLTMQTLTTLFSKYTGTNISLAEIIHACSDLQLEYRDRGFPTVNVTLPPQQITNGIVKVRVFEGRLSEIQVSGNHYFSSNNIMRALPSLQTNMIINGPLFQAELDRANANQDRQIYPQLEPGDEENTTALLLKVKDRLPVHGKIEINNQSSPGTPELRINSSAVYNNLWQYEHSLGVQYSFSPEEYKVGDWSFYDLPLVANYSAFYRMPLSSPEDVFDYVATEPGSFGYDEATRRFRLPPPSGGSELNFYGSRSTIDTGLTTPLNAVLFSTNGTTLDRQDIQRDLTINENLGARFSIPVFSSEHFQSTVSGNLDFKRYSLESFKTNVFTLTQVEIDTETNPGHPTTNIVVSVDRSQVPTTRHDLDYVPISLHWDGSEKDNYGITSMEVGYSLNFWHSGSAEEVQEITSSTRSKGQWSILTASVTRDQMIYTNWTLSLHADGQIASEPLISNEQYGLGGVNSLRGYREGEVFGDSGWRVSAEQKTPPYVVGLAYGKSLLTVRGSAFVDYGELYLSDPNGKDARTPLWDAGFGWVTSVGPHWEARFFFAWPFLNTLTTEAGHPRFDFAITAQF